MLFLVYDNDGKINQANKVYDPKPEHYQGVLDDAGVQHIALDLPGIISADHWFVDDGAKLSERPDMGISLKTPDIKVGENDAAIFTGVPNNCQFTMYCLGAVVETVQLHDSTLELSVPAPGSFFCRFALWPYKDATFTVVAS